MLAHSRSRRAFRCVHGLRINCRGLLTLAIETSCDDTSVAILEKHNDSEGNAGRALEIHHHAKVTSNSLAYRGIHPVVALESHHQNLARLVHEAVPSLPKATAAEAENCSSITVRQNGRTVHLKKPDFISVTRGPGMRSNLSVGLDSGKALAVAWQVPFVGVHHMQAHALTPRLVSAMESPESVEHGPEFPFLSLLVSGGHTMLIHSESLASHPILATTCDIAIGDALDKMARCVLSEEVLSSSKSTMYGPVLESFAFPRGQLDYEYSPPAARQDEIEPRGTRWSWALTLPLSKTNALKYSFAGLCSSVERIIETAGPKMLHEERQDLAREAMRVAFEHLASRVVLGLKEMENHKKSATPKISTLVVSGGVAANRFLKHLLRAFLDARGFSHIKLSFPPLYLCTDNAMMIGWAGMEMFEAGWKTKLSCRALRKWSLDPNADDGGIMGVDGWERLPRPYDE